MIRGLDDHNTQSPLVRGPCGRRCPGQREFGRPAVFHGHPDLSRWLALTLRSPGVRRVGGTVHREQDRHR